MNLTTTQFTPIRSSFALATFIALSLLLLAIPDSATAQFRVSFKATLQPFIRLTPGFTAQPVPASINTHVTNSADPSGPQTSAQLDEARARLIEMEDRIRKLRGMLPPQDADFREPPGVKSTVIARRAVWQEPVLGLDKGTSDGVRTDAGALCRGAVAGRIVAAGPRASSLALLTHPGVTIGARLMQSRIEGILQGTKSAEGAAHLCRLQIVAKEIKTQPGEQVVTSGLDGVFPPGLWLGTVVSVTKTSSFQWQLEVQPACDESRIEAVHVLTIRPPEVPWPVTKK